MQAGIRQKVDSSRGSRAASPQSLDTLAEALRRDLVAELQEYAAMLANLEGQANAILTQSSGQVLRSVSDLNAQVQRTNAMCSQRQQSQQQLARSLRQPEDAPFTTLTPLLPPKYRPAIDALVRENNELRSRIQTRLRQNQLLFTKSVEMVQGLAGHWA